ncbi:tetratricopeptide repeat protein [Oceanobacillus limi]|nr:tetratricopeptide repeat protein [Oceanobacillus limi]
MTDVLDVGEQLNKFSNGVNEEDIHVIVEEFRRGHFLHVLSRTNRFREKHEMNREIERTLSFIDAICHTQIGEKKKAADIIKVLYKDSTDASISNVILFGNVAFMCDFKLTRKIMSDAVKQIDAEDDFDQLEAARAYVVLGEAEETLEKFVRAIKYYQRALLYVEKAEEQESELVLFLNFKLGTLHSRVNKKEEAIEHFQHTIELSTDENVEIKVNSLVSIAKLYGSKKAYEKASSHLREAISIMEDSNTTLTNKFAHAEAYTEMAYNYFDQAKYEEALPYYDRAIAIHLKVPNYSARELGIIYMQYAYCLEHKDQQEKLLAGIHYEKAYGQLEKTSDMELIRNALGDIIAFFDRMGNKKKKNFYENKFVKMENEKFQMH